MGPFAVMDGRFVISDGRLAQLVRALARQARGHWFEPSIAHSPWIVRLRDRIAPVALRLWLEENSRRGYFSFFRPFADPSSGA